MLDYINISRDFQIYFKLFFPGRGFDSICRAEVKQRTFHFVEHFGCDTNTTSAYTGLLGFSKTKQLHDSFKSFRADGLNMGFVL